jgi:hypothetical protein
MLPLFTIHNARSSSRKKLATPLKQFTAFWHGQQVLKEMTLGQKLRELRKTKRLSLRELASSAK